MIAHQTVGNGRITRTRCHPAVVTRTILRQAHLLTVLARIAVTAASSGHPAKGRPRIEVQRVCDSGRRIR